VLGFTPTLDQVRVATLVVSIQNELGAIKIGSKMYDNPYNNKTLPLV
jgi:hypothetical protein